MNKSIQLYPPLSFLLRFLSPSYLLVAVCVPRAVLIIQALIYASVDVNASWNWQKACRGFVFFCVQVCPSLHSHSNNEQCVCIIRNLQIKLWQLKGMKKKNLWTALSSEWQLGLATA